MQFLISGALGEVMHEILCHVAYAKGFPVHILCCTNLRCWAADLFTGRFIKMTHSKMLLIFIHLCQLSSVSWAIQPKFPNVVQIHRSSQ